jgi:two-component SAPR family response regulator
MSDRPLAECRILIVEDEYMIADNLREELESAGAVVLGPVSDVEDALAVLSCESRVDGAILDINLAGETSYPVADELTRRQIRFVFTTGYDRHAVPEQYRHITRCQKPIQPARVRDAIRSAIYG